MSTTTPGQSMIVAPRPLAVVHPSILDTAFQAPFGRFTAPDMEFAHAAAAVPDAEMGMETLTEMETLAHLHAHLHGLGLASMEASPAQGAPRPLVGADRSGGADPPRRSQASLRRKRQLPQLQPRFSTSSSQPRSSLDSDSPRSGSGSDSDAPPHLRSNTPDSNYASGSGSEQGNSCPNTPSMNASLALAGGGAVKPGKHGRPAIAAGDDVLENEIQIRSPELDLPPYDALITPAHAAQPLAIRISTATTLNPGRASMSSDEDMHPSAISARTGRSSWYSQPDAEDPELLDQEANRLSRLSRLTGFDSARASMQTYGSSVLTYGSRTSRHMVDAEPQAGDDDAQLPPRPTHPLPWDPRPTALDRIHGNAGRRPLPPIPTPGLLPPSAQTNASTDADDVEPAAPKVIPARRPRPLPKTPGSLSDIAEDTEGSVAGGSSSRPASMFASPTDAAPSSSLPTGMRSRRYSSESFFFGSAMDDSTMDVDSGSRTPGSRRGSVALHVRRRASRASIRSTASAGTYAVPDVDELVRILDAMDVDGNGSLSRRATTLRSSTSPTPAKRAKHIHHARADTEEIDAFGSALARCRGVTSVPGGKGPEAALDGMTALAEEGAFERTTPLVTVTGLPTPAATPKASPERAAHGLPKTDESPSKKNKLRPPPLVHSHSFSHTPSESSAPPSANARYSIPSAISHSPSPSVLSFSGFPLPPDEFGIPGPSAVEVGEMPIPQSATSSVGQPRSPGAAWALGGGKSLAECATLPGLEAYLAGSAPKTPPPTQPINTVPLRQSPPKPTREAIADLRNRVAGLGRGGVPTPSAPILSQPVPPSRRRAQSSATRDVPATEVKPMSTSMHRPPAIDIKAANASSAKPGYGVGAPAGSGASSAPLLGAPAQLGPPTIVYATPNVAPLRLRKPSNASLLDTVAEMPSEVTIVLPPPSDVPQSAQAAMQAFPRTEAGANAVGNGTRQHRSASLYVSPSAGTPATAPLRFRSSHVSMRARSATLDIATVAEDGAATMPMKKRPTSAMSPRTPTGNNAEWRTPISAMPPPAFADSSPAKTVVPEKREDNNPQVPSPLTPPSNFAPGLGNTSFGFGSISSSEMSAGFDSGLQDIISTIAGASEEEQMGSLLTLASSINTDVHSGLGGRASTAESFMIMPGDEDFFTSVNAGVSKGSGTKGAAGAGSKGLRGRTPSVAAKVRAAIEALPDPNTFPIPGPPPTSSGTDSSARAGGADYSSFDGLVRPSPLPRLRVVTKFKGNTTLLPASKAPLSAVSTKSASSSMSTVSSSYGVGKGASGYGHGGSGSGRVGGPRKMNRLTLTDPRSPMADAAIAAAQLVVRMREKRAALAQRGIRVPGAPIPNGNGDAERGVGRARSKRGAGHRRTGSGGTLRSKLKMSGGGFFGSGPVPVKSSPKKGLVALPDIDVDVSFGIDDVHVHEGPRRMLTGLHIVEQRGSMVSMVPSHVHNP